MRSSFWTLWAFDIWPMRIRASFPAARCAAWPSPALVCNPAVILADEPTSDLDDENTQIVLRRFRDAADAGAAVLVATHDQAAVPFADRVLRLDGGQLVG